MRHSIRRHRKINRRITRRPVATKIKYKCVRLRSKSKKNRRTGGAAAVAAPTMPTTATFPMVIDQNNVMYSCTAMPSS
jgi:hypothetical protein